MEHGVAEEHDFGILLGLAYQAFVAELHQALAAAGFDDVKPSFGFVLRVLDRGPRTASQLAELLDISNPGSTKIVGEMVAAGYVERRPDPADGRARLLFLSARGQAALAAARRFHRSYERSLIQRHGSEAVTALRDLLTAMARGRVSDDAPDARLRAMFI